MNYLTLFAEAINFNVSEADVALFVVFLLSFFVPVAIFLLIFGVYLKPGFLASSEAMNARQRKITTSKFALTFYALTLFNFLFIAAAGSSDPDDKARFGWLPPIGLLTIVVTVGFAIVAIAFLIQEKIVLRKRKVSKVKKPSVPKKTGEPVVWNMNEVPEDSADSKQT